MSLLFAVKSHPKTATQFAIAVIIHAAVSPTEKLVGEFNADKVQKSANSNEGVNLVAVVVNPCDLVTVVGYASVAFAISLRFFVG